MSLLLLEFSKSFISGRIDVHTFVNGYMELWRIERDTNILLNDSGRLSEILSSVFCIADLYNSESDKEYYELGSNELYENIKDELYKLEA